MISPEQADLVSAQMENIGWWIHDGDSDCRPARQAGEMDRLAVATAVERIPVTTSTEPHTGTNVLAVARKQVLERGERLTKQQILDVLALPDDGLTELLGLTHEVRTRWCDPEVVEGITVSVKTDGCSEDCRFCSQSGQFEPPAPCRCPGTLPMPRHPADAPAPCR